MTDDVNMPLLADERDSSDGTTSERSPLLANSNTTRYDGGNDNIQSSGVKKKIQQRWPSVVALALLTVVFLVGITAGFVAPTIAEKYATQSAVIKPTHVSVESYSAEGVTIRAQASVQLDSTRVKNAAVRRLGKLLTAISKKVEATPGDVSIVLPEYGDALLGHVLLPKVVLDIRDRHKNDIDILIDAVPAGPDGFRRLAYDWVEGRLQDLHVRGEGNIRLKSGLLPLGTQWLSHTIAVPFDKVPELPKYKLDDVRFHAPNNSKTMLVDARVTVKNDYPLNVVVPPVAVNVLVPNCLESDPYLQIASIQSEQVAIRAHKPIHAIAHGSIQPLPEDLTKICPKSRSSPLDLLLRSYVQGHKTKVFVRGSGETPNTTPAWLRDLMKSVTVPITVPGRPTDNLIKNFSLTDVNVHLPIPGTDPNKPEGQIRISALIKALIGLPKELKIPVNVTRVRATADVFYHGDKLGELNLKKWQPANSSHVDMDDKKVTGILVQSSVNNAPLEVTNDELFSEVIQKLILGGKPVDLDVKANVDVEVDISFGKPVVRDIPAAGKITIKPIGRGFGHGLGGLSPKINSIDVLSTTATALSIRASANFSNPTKYSAEIPYLSVFVLKNGSTLAEVVMHNVTIKRGLNSGIIAEADWRPRELSGAEGAETARQLLSQYMSGENVTLTVRTHDGTFPSLPRLGRALSSLNIELPVPHLSLPKPRRPPGEGDGDGKDDGRAPHFVNDATLHLLSSTATFIILSPFKKITLYVTSINATAYYNHTEKVGHIDYDLPFAIPPNSENNENDGTLTPRLPVDWNLGDVGFDAVKKALGGSLKLDAKAVIGVRIDEFEETLDYEGHGIGAKVRP